MKLLNIVEGEMRTIRVERPFEIPGIVADSPDSINLIAGALFDEDSNTLKE
jgi:hypothetical protein